MSLRNYQERLVQDIRVAMRSHDRVLAVLPTGGGKTRIFCEIAECARARGAKVQVLVHRRELVEQTPDPSVMTIQSWTPAGEDLVIIDEAHHACARTWKDKLMQCSRVLGVTATPQRLDGGGLDEIFDVMVQGPGVGQLMDDGWLSRYKLFCPPGKPDLARVRKVGGDYNKRQLNMKVGDSKVVAAAVRNWQLLAGGRQTIGFCVSVAHMEQMEESFRSAGVRVTMIDGKMARARRDGAVAAFRDGVVQVLLSVDLISEGFDVPACDCVLMLRPTASLGLYLQQVGRGLRPGEQHAVILDCAGNAERHGMPDDEHVWSLMGTKKERAGLVPNLPVRVCGQCFGVHKPHLRVCPYCNFHHPLDARIPEEADILLEEKEQLKRSMRRAVGRARTEADLRAIAKERGYHPGWVHRILKSRH